MRKRVPLITSKWPYRWCVESQKHFVIVSALKDLRGKFDFYYNNPKQCVLSRITSKFICFLRDASARRGFLRFLEDLGLISDLKLT